MNQQEHENSPSAATPIMSNTPHPERGLLVRIAEASTELANATETWIEAEQKRSNAPHDTTELKQEAERAYTAMNESHDSLLNLMQKLKHER